MLNGNTIAFIGSGIMGEAMIKGLLRQNLVAPGEIIASGPREERGRELVERYGIRVTTDNVEAATGADIVVLSVSWPGTSSPRPWSCPSSPGRKWTPSTACWPCLL